jgi:tetratricopeptide (TPR) repeat protein
MPAKNKKNKTPKPVISDTNTIVLEINDFSQSPASQEASLTPSTNAVATVNMIPASSITGKTLCLNMIVKNESKVITRLLASVAKYIDCYCICDTGSTDNTIEIIQNFFASQNPPIPGVIIQEPFRDFGYNRTFALKACEAIDVKYVILLDADMILKVNPSFTKQDLHRKLVDDVYYIFQGSDTFFYKNVRVVRNKIGMSYWGVTHEYVRTPEGSRYGKFEKNEVFINDIGDGGSKADKFIRDIRLLTKGLEDEPNNDRYTFYLANSYRDAGQHDNAISTYKKRIELGGWFDEVWQSYYNIGKCYRNMGDMPNAIYWWMEGYNFFPNRIENLYEIIHHYRCNGKNNLAYGFYIMADEERKKNTHNDYLFLQKDVYDYKIDYELTIIGYYCNYLGYDLIKSSMKVLNYPHVDENIARNVMSNYKFYSKQINVNNRLSPQQISVLKSIGNTLPELQCKLGEFVPSTPTMCVNMEGELVVNVRFVNYKINDKGGYENPGSIATINVVAVINIEEEDWELDEEFILGYNTDYDNLYIGLEDIRIFRLSSDPRIFFNANRGLNYHSITIEHGTIDMGAEETVSGLMKIDGQREVEKNWVLFEDANQKMKIIYNWSPLVIGDIKYDNNITASVKGLPPMNFVKTHEIKNPYFFKHLRGSTNGVKIGNEVWFICHSVSYEDRRYYYHIFVVLDASTYEVKKYTPFFTFQKEKVEYTLGFTYFPGSNEFLIGYSIMDRETEYVSLKKHAIDLMMVTNV